MKYTMILLAVAWSLTGAAQAVTVFASDGDSEVQYTLSTPPYAVISSTALNLFSGCAGGTVGKERCPVFPILLPDLGAVINPFTEVSFIFNYESKQNSPIGNVDVYGLGRRASSAVLTNDYWTGTSAVDSTDATLLAQDLITANSSDYGLRTVSGAALADYLNAQYAGGAGAGQYVFVRLSTDTAQTGGASRYIITSADGGIDATRPRLVYSTVMNGHASDAEVQFTLSSPPYKVISEATAVLYSGSAGSVGKERCPVIPFQLPDFGAVAAPFTNTTSFIFNYEGKQNTVVGNVDVYGLGRRANPTVLTNDYWTGTSAVDSTDATLIAQNVITVNSTDYGLRTVSNAALIDYLNAQYANGAGAEQYVFLRLSTDTPQTGNANRYLITSSEGGTDQTRPQIIYNGDEVLNARPFIWVRDGEKQQIVAKINSNPWAQSVYFGMVNRVASMVASHQSDRDAFIRQLPVLWDDNPPKFKTVPTYTRGTVIYPTEDLFNAGVDCAVLYYLTGNESYARCAADILHNAVQALLPVSPSTSVGNGGWLDQNDLLYEARYLGTQLPIIYDFIYPYLQTHTVYDVDAAGDVSFVFNDAQTVFRTYYNLVRTHGQSASNWSALMSTCMLNNLLALDNDAERATALQTYLVTGTSRQSSLATDYLQYSSVGDIWPESLQYAAGVGEIRSFHMVLLERIYPELNLFDTYPNLPLSLSRIRYLRYPNNTEQISFGDGHRDREDQPFLQYEMVYRHAQDRGRTELAQELGSLINGGIADGEYNRSTVDNYSGLSPHNEPLQLLWQAESVTEPAESLVMPRTDRLPFAGIALQRNLSSTGNANDGLMAFVGGGAHVHSHASGMSMELYGMGQVMGAKSGRSTYQTSLHENHYRLFAANNTVIVNGASRGSGGWAGLGINTVNLISMEPQPFEAAVSSNFSFTCSSFSDNKGSLAEATQQRTMAIVRTSPTTGFYVDFFRSRSTVTNRIATTLNGSVNDQYHDYIYRNIGVLNGSIQTSGATLPLYAQANRFQNDIGDFYDQPGWSYFTNTEVSYPHSASLRAQFKATPTGKSTIYMDMHMPAVDTREVARVDSPAIVDAPAPYNNALAPTLVIRKIGDAWDKPFVSVFEPHAGAGGGTVQNTTTLWRSGTAVGVKVESIVGGSNVMHYVFSNTGDNQTYAEPSIGLSFTGRFGMVADYGNASYELYLGDGSSLSYRGNTVASVSGSDTEASVVYAAGKAPVVNANSAVNVTAASAPGITQLVPGAVQVMSITGSGSIGVPYRFWATTNLLIDAWSVINSGVVTENPFVVEDPAATNDSKFYRFSTP